MERMEILGENNPLQGVGALQKSVVFNLKLGYNNTCGS
jgi:hypothetical protein